MKMENAAKADEDEMPSMLRKGHATVELGRGSYDLDESRISNYLLSEILVIMLWSFCRCSIKTSLIRLHALMILALHLSPTFRPSRILQSLESLQYHHLVDCCHINVILLPSSTGLDHKPLLPQV